MTISIVLAKDFSPFPAGRYIGDGPYSGEAFREQHLIPALNANDKVTVKLDGSEGYGSSFLEEAFGGLVREGYFSAAKLHERLVLVSEDPMLVEEAWQYIDQAEPADPN